MSFTEILGDLENKDLQLTVAMQDLTIATGEIMKAAEMRRRLQKMEKLVIISTAMYIVSTLFGKATPYN